MDRNRMQKLMVMGLIAASIFEISACGIIRPTRQRRGDAERSGFLGDYSRLKERDGYEAQEVYVNPSAQWSTYKAIYIESATLWTASEAAQKLSKEDQKMLTDMLYQSVYNKLGEKFKMADRPGPNVLKLRIAFTEAEGANIALNVVTTVIPQIRIVSTVVGLSADTAVIVGSARGEVEMNDSITNERLAAAVDSRAGTKGILRAFSKWADVQAITDYWAERMQEFLVAQGVPTKPGAAK